MILFADRHYGTHAGRWIAGHLSDLTDVVFVEEDYDALIRAIHDRPGEALAFHAIFATPGNESMPPEMESVIRTHLDGGADVWILHGGSAAFWPWTWWRQLMRVRWVRKDDEDVSTPSWHPVIPYRIEVTDTGEARCPGLESLDLPEDELYVNLHQSGDIETWMTAEYEGVAWPQVYTHPGLSGGTVYGWIPGHKPEVIRSERFRHTFRQVAQCWLRSP